jgi:hypothetical protein
MLVAQLAKYHAIAATLLGIVHCPIGCIEERVGAIVEYGSRTAARRTGRLRPVFHIRFIGKKDAGPSGPSDSHHVACYRKAGFFPDVLLQKYMYCERGMYHAWTS